MTEPAADGGDGVPLMNPPIRYYHVLGAIAGIGAIASFFAVSLSQACKVGITVAWLVVPPLFFFCELHLVRRYKPDQLERCKLSQESAAKVWAGIAAALALLYFDKHVS